MSCDFEEMFGEIVGYGAQATVYARGDYAVKLYREDYQKEFVFAEGHMMAMLEKIQFPSPKVYEILLVDGRYGLRMERVKGKAVGEDLLDPTKRDATLDALVDLQIHLQKHEAPDAFSLKQRYYTQLKQSTRLSEDIKKELLIELDKLPDGQALCHCDFHGGNVFFDGTKCTIIDIAQLSKGDPAADAACSYVAYYLVNQDLAEIYLNKYCTKSEISKKEVKRWARVYAGTLLGQVPEHFTPIIEHVLAAAGAANE